MPFLVCVYACLCFCFIPGGDLPVTPSKSILKQGPSEYTETFAVLPVCPETSASEGTGLQDEQKSRLHKLCVSPVQVREMKEEADISYRTGREPEILESSDILDVTPVKCMSVSRKKRSFKRDRGRDFRKRSHYYKKKYGEELKDVGEGFGVYESVRPKEGGKTFSKRSHLDYRQRHYSQEKQFKCRVCEKAFRWRSNCVRHEKIHTGVKPYKCSVCEKAFQRRSAYHLHQKTHTKQKMESRQSRDTATCKLDRSHRLINQA